MNKEVGKQSKQKANNNKQTNELLVNQYFFTNQPFMAGFILKIFKGPRLANCPKLSSIQNKGMPSRAREMKYGTRKAPEMFL